MSHEAKRQAEGGDSHSAFCPLRMAYVLLWFPLSSETFIFREIEELRGLGAEIDVYTMYGESLKGCSRAMRDYSGPVTRMGIRAFFRIFGAFFRTLARNPVMTLRLMRRCLFRRMRNFESLAENTWCFFAGFLLAECCLSSQIRLIHSAWANGPATAAWVASEISGIPFAFTGRAGDIYPPDGLLAEKIADAAFVRANNNANVEWLSKFCKPEDAEKIYLVYNGLTFQDTGNCQSRAMPGEHRILAVGRFARTKGFPYLLTAMARLKRENFPVRLTLVGDGSWRKKLERLRDRLNLEDCVSMPGFIPNDRLNEYMQNHSLLVVPSVIHANGDRDGIPNVIMEALSRGLPVVATDVCGISEVIHDGKTGLLVPQRDASALAGAIRNMLEDPNKATKMAQNGCRLVKEMFNTESNGRRLLELYKTVVCPDYGK